MLEAIAAANGINLHTKLLAHGGYTLQDHLNDSRLKSILDSISWDYAVLNEQSTLGENHLIDGLPRVRESHSFYESVRKLNAKIVKSGTKPIIISLYPRKNSPSRDGKILDYSYMKIAKELKMKIAPVHSTWKAISNKKENWQLYIDDNLHPTPLGSYITASVLYSTMMNNMSKPMDKEIFGPFVDEFDGYQFNDSIVSLIKMDYAKSKFIAEIAYENVNNLNRAGGYLHLDKPK